MNNYNNSVIYGIYEKTLNKLLYIGSSSNYNKRKKQHISKIEKPSSTCQVIHSFIVNNQIQYEFKIIQNVNCDSKHDLEQLENKLIENLNPPLNIKKFENVRKCLNCNRICSGTLCRICESVNKQFKTNILLTLKPSKSGCEYCGCKDEFYRNPFDITKNCRICFDRENSIGTYGMIMEDFIENGDDRRYYVEINSDEYSSFVRYLGKKSM